MVGCGGGGGGSSVPSVYRGTWYGGFTDADGKLNVIEMEVSDSGAVSGKAREPGTAATGALITTLSGKLATGGGISLKLKHPDGSTQTVAGTASLSPDGIALDLELVPDPTKPNEKVTVPFERQAATNVSGPLSGELRIDAGGGAQTLQLQSDRGVVSGLMELSVRTPDGNIAVEARLGDDSANAHRRIIGWSADGRVMFGTYTAGADSMDATVDLQWKEDDGTLSTTQATINLHR